MLLAFFDKFFLPTGNSVLRNINRLCNLFLGMAGQPQVERLIALALLLPELKAQGERRGGDTSSGEQRNPVNSPECSGKETREIAAQKAGFGSEFTYRQAKTVVQNASPELVEAELKAQGERRCRPKAAGEDIRLNLDEYSGQRTDQIAAEKADHGAQPKASNSAIRAASGSLSAWRSRRN